MRQPSVFATERIERLARAIESIMDADDPGQVLGADLIDRVARIPSDGQVTPGAMVRLSLLNDTACLAERALGADGPGTPQALDYVAPLCGETQKYLAHLRPVYRESGPAGASAVQSFLARHAADGERFGGSCASTAWVGLSLCKRAAELTGDPHFVDEYRDLMVRLLADLFGGIGSGSPENEQAVVQELNRLAPLVTVARDPRDAAYCSPASPDVFHAEAHGSEVFSVDPFDVEEIHAEARAAFSRLV